jgi:hypothetical protein
MAGATVAGEVVAADCLVGCHWEGRLMGSTGGGDGGVGDVTPTGVTGEIDGVGVADVVDVRRNWADETGGKPFLWLSVSARELDSGSETAVGSKVYPLLGVLACLLAVGTARLTEGRRKTGMLRGETGPQMSVFAWGKR